MANRSNYPDSLDTFIEKHEILASDVANIQRYQQLLLKSPRTTDEDTEFTNLKITLNDKLVSSEDWNKLQDCITNMESYLTTNIDTHMQTTIANADSDIDIKVQSVKSYLDTTNAGSIRNDLGLPTDLVTTDKSTVVNAVNEVKGQINTHSTNTSNPHSTTASQVGAYSKTEADSKFATSTIPYFYTRTSTAITYSTANSIQQIPINTTNTGFINGCTIGTNEIVFQQAGKYMFEGLIDYSGLNNLQTAELLIRVFAADGTYGDDNHIVIGWNGLGGNYSYGGIPVYNTRVVNVEVNGKVQFFARVSEAPRNINQVYLKGWKISN